MGGVSKTTTSRVFLLSLGRRSLNSGVFAGRFFLGADLQLVRRGSAGRIDVATFRLAINGKFAASVGFLVGNAFRGAVNRSRTFISLYVCAVFLRTKTFSRSLSVIINILDRVSRAATHATRLGMSFGAFFSSSYLLQEPVDGPHRLNSRVSHIKLLARNKCEFRFFLVVRNLILTDTQPHCQRKVSIYSSDSP